MNRRRLGVLAATVVTLTAASVAAHSAHAAQPQAFEQNVSADRTTDSGEPMVAVNPTNRQNVIVTYTQTSLGQDLFHQVVPGTRNLQGTNQCGYAVSRDGGHTWERRPIPDVDLVADPAHAGCADPNVVFSPTGTAYISTGTFGPVVNGDIRVITSVDGGSTWSQPVVVGHTLPEQGWSPSGSDSYVGLLTDQPWLAVDASTGDVYVSWREYRAVSGGSSPFGDTRYMSVSKDGGASFSAAAAVDSTQYPGGDAPIAAANGTVAVAYVPSSGCSCVVFALSRDGGRTFSHTATPFTGSAPHIATDPSHPGRYSVLVVQRNGAAAAVYVTDDAGATWSSAAVVIGATTGSQDTRTKPWLSYSPLGVLGAMWRTTHGDGTYEAWASVSRDGGRTFGEPRRISAAPSPPPGQDYVAGDDFSTVTLTRDRLYAGWGDWRSGHLDAWIGGFSLAG